MLRSLFTVYLALVGLAASAAVPNQYILKVATTQTAYSLVSDLGSPTSAIASSYRTRFSRPGVQVLGAIRQPRFDLVLVNLTASVSTASFVAQGVQVYPNNVVRKSANSSFATWGHVVSF